MKSVNIGLRRDAFLICGLATVLILAELVITSQFHRSILTLSVIYSIAAIGLSLLLGYAGQVSIGQGAFMGLGAYAAAFCIQKIGLPVPLTIIVATLLSATFGYFLARPILRLSGHNLALATLALGAVFFVFASQWREVTGGLDPGIIDLPSLEIGGFTHGRVVLWLAETFLVVCAALAVTVVGGRFGRALKTLRTSEVVAACMGIDVARTKAAVFAIAAGFAGLSGCLFALYLRSFNAGAFGVGLSIELLMMVIIGSLSTIWGAIFGAFAIVLLPNLLEGFDHAKHLIYGLTMVGIMMFAPNGLGEAIARLLLRRRRSA